MPDAALLMKGGGEVREICRESVNMLCGAHVFKEGKTLRVLLALFSASSVVHLA